MNQGPLQAEEVRQVPLADDELCERACLALARLGRQIRESLTVSVREGVVKLTGQCSSFYLRQQAIECIRRTPDVREIVDEIVIDITSCQGRSLLNSGDHSDRI